MKLRDLALCLAALVACSPGGPAGKGDVRDFVTTNHPSIILITLDTTRPDHIAPYGADDVETPALSALADQGIVFEHAAATAPMTGPAHASLLTGLHPRRNGVRNNLTHHLPEDVLTLAEWLSTEGYRTAAFVSAVVLEGRYGFDQGFEVYDDDMQSRITNPNMPMTMERPAASTAERALAWLDALGDDEPYLLWVHFYDPHLPYSPPSPWAERYSGRPYDGEIAYMDSQVGRLLQHPQAVGDNVVVMAIGDHGESLGEHGEKSHGLLLYESTIWVPWIVKFPNGPRSVRISAPISQVDLVPTIVDLVNNSSANGFEGLEGRSLLPLLRGDDWTSERPVFAEAESGFFSYGWSRLRSVRQGKLKFIDAPKVELYDLDDDPDEKTNLADYRQADVRRLAGEIAAWSANGGAARGAPTVDAKTVEMLRALGYSAGDPGRPEGEGHGNPVELIGVHEELQEIQGLMASSQLVEAVRRVRLVLDRDPDNLSALNDLSHGLMQLGRLDEAAEVAARAISVAPWSGRALKTEAEVEYLRGRYQLALDLIDQALELDDRFLEARVDRSRYLAALQRHDEAVADLETLLEQSPDNEWVALRYAEIVELGSGDYRAAEQRIRTVLSRDPYFTQAWLLLADVLEAENRSSDAAGVYREALGYRPNNPDLHTGLALLLAESGNPSAEPALRQAIASSLTVRADLQVALGELLAARGNVGEARRHFEVAANAPIFSAGTQNAKAMALLQLGRTDEAETLWRDLIRDQPAYWRAWLNMASLSIQRRDWAAVEKFARAAIEREPTSADAWNDLAIGLEELGRTSEAEAAYKRASEVDPDDYRALFNLGILLRKNGRYNEAATVQQGVLARAPRHGGAHFELGMLYAGPLADLDLARAHLQAAIEADPNHPRARQARAILDRLP